MKIEICSMWTIQDINPSVPHIIISISCSLNTSVTIPQNQNCLGVHKAIFHDIDKEIPSCTMISNQHAKDILDFVFKYKDSAELIICQCAAGISRSSGVAIALSEILNGVGSSSWIYDCGRYIPNKKVVSVILDEYYNKQQKEI